MKIVNLKKIKERPRELDKNYYYIDIDEFEIFETEEDFNNFDDFNYKIGNYFYTKEQATKFLEKIKKTYKDFRVEELKNGFYYEELLDDYGMKDFLVDNI